ncbi:hypothetical protein C1H46_040178 [Malus baccata]|uniref:Uncharacterized protein n=1 Tax=Malus baccata TaxID=106549 RepID=A0A540KJB7_MALBA|nr:hypothetical protein C1H46_040178 [Malus baccata]
MELGAIKRSSSALKIQVNESYSTVYAAGERKGSKLLISKKTVVPFVSMRLPSPILFVRQVALLTVSLLGYPRVDHCRRLCFQFFLTFPSVCTSLSHSAVFSPLISHSSSDSPSLTKEP